MKARSVYYFAHPVRPPCACEGPSRDHHGHCTFTDCNVARAKRWLRWCWNRAPNVSIVAPWLPHVELLDDGNPEHRERGLRDNEAIAARCDGIIHAGGRISAGMKREEIAVIRRGGAVVDLTPIGVEPPIIWRRDSPIAGLVKILQDLA